MDINNDLDIRVTNAFERNWKLMQEEKNTSYSIIVFSSMHLVVENLALY